MRQYRPRRAGRKWLEGAPEYVLDCFDNRGQTIDRYTVLFGGSMWTPEMGRTVQGLGMSGAPEHPQGVSRWDDVPADYRPRHDRVRWLDLPEHIRRHVIARATST